MPDVQVDAGMMSCVPFQNPQPQGGFAVWAEDSSMANRFTTNRSQFPKRIAKGKTLFAKHKAIAMRSTQPRLLCLADTKNASGPLPHGRSTQAGRASCANGLLILAPMAKPPREHHHNCRAPLPGHAPKGPTPGHDPMPDRAAGEIIMTTRMLIDARHRKKPGWRCSRATVLKNSTLILLITSRSRAISIWPRSRVEPSLQAAFVDFGGNRHGFLAFSEIHPDYYQIPKEDREALLAEEAAHAEEEAALRAVAEGEEDFVGDDELGEGWPMISPAAASRKPAR
jgi:hypothetical protein